MSENKSIQVIIILILTLSLTASCTTHYQIHPGSVSKADSAAYDALLVAQATIDQAKRQNAEGDLPKDLKVPLNVLIQTYNLARDSWLLYRGAVSEKVAAEAYFERLTQNITDLTKAIRTFKEAK